MQALECLIRRGVKRPIITLGEQGCVYYDGENTVHRPAYKAKTVDTTSAGDCFIGALAVQLSRGGSLSEAVNFASKASAIAVSRPGAAESIPFADEIK